MEGGGADMRVYRDTVFRYFALQLKHRGIEWRFFVCEKNKRWCLRQQWPGLFLSDAFSISLISVDFELVGNAFK
jgi:hypothetical protein